MDPSLSADSANVDSDPSATGGVKSKLRKFAPKAIGFVAMGFFMGFLADFAATRNSPEQPAGLVWGMAHGALMPATLPALVMGKNVTIYAPHNQGRIYKIGYALGVNICGLIFFGLLFWSPKKREPNADSLAAADNPDTSKEPGKAV
jgi:hypothetical protein